MIMTPEQRATILTNASIATDESADQATRSAALAELRVALDDVQANCLDCEWFIERIIRKTPNFREWQYYPCDNNEESARKAFAEACHDSDFRPGQHVELGRSVRGPYRVIETCAK